MQYSKKESFHSATPEHIVQKLDRFIIGQSDAKKKVAVALRHRYLRTLLAPEMKKEVQPKNILMVGPTGVGKTEIVRRLAALLEAPFIKVEATKFTEVGYVGRDVESIIRDLVEKYFKEYRQKSMDHISSQVMDAVWEKIAEKIQQEHFPEASIESLIGDLSAGLHGDLEIDIEVTSLLLDVEIMAPPGMEDMTSQLQQVFQSLGSEKKKKKQTIVSEAVKILKEEESLRLVDEDQLRKEVIEHVQEQGIVFIDEIDKVCQRHGLIGGDVSREGVQRDLLPLIEGCAVNTRYGIVHTDHILFITSGAFQMAKPSDLIAELQGRLPIRVDLHSLTQQDFVDILSKRDLSLLEQYTALLEKEGVELIFDPSGIEMLAKIASDLNTQLENIGARRLYTVMEKLLEDIFFHPNIHQKVIIDAAFVEAQLVSLNKVENLHLYVL